MPTMTRPRRKGNTELPNNLYRYHDPRTDRTYYRYRDPRTGKFHGLGTNHVQAVADALALNAAILVTLQSARIAAIAKPVQTASSPTLGRVILHHLERAEKLHERGRLADNTLKAKRSHGEAWRLRLGSLPIGDIGVRDIAEALAGYIDQGKERAAQALRSEAIEIWKTALSEGWVDDNPAAKTRAITPEIKRARLTLEVFQAIYQQTENTWLKNAMALALLTGQRREDIALAQFSEIHDGGWWCVQKKTGSRVFLPLELRLDVFGQSLEEVVRQCRSTNILSRHIIHQTHPRGNSPVGSPIWKDTLTKAFHAEVLALGNDWEGKQPPTFHELRSLAERLYAAQGNVNTQTLLGHRDPRSTALYKDTRGAEWVMVKVG